MKKMIDDINQGSCKSSTFVDGIWRLAGTDGSKHCALQVWCKSSKPGIIKQPMTEAHTFSWREVYLRKMNIHFVLWKAFPIVVTFLFLNNGKIWFSFLDIRNFKPRKETKLFTLLILYDMDAKQSQAHKCPNHCFNASSEISRKICNRLVLISPVHLSLFAVTTAVNYFYLDFIFLHALWGIDATFLHNS